MTATAATAVAGGEAQRFVKGADIAADWWTLFHSKPLNDLIAQALANNHDLKAAQAALLVAQRTYGRPARRFLPGRDGSFAASRQTQPGSLAPVPSNNAFTYNLFTPQVSVSYVPDVFGLTRRTVESFKAQEEDAHYQTGRGLHHPGQQCRRSPPSRPARSRRRSPPRTS